MQIETGRLLLRDFMQNDVQAVHTFDSDPELRRYRGGGRATEEDTPPLVKERSNGKGRSHDQPMPLRSFSKPLLRSSEWSVSPSPDGNGTRQNCGIASVESTGARAI
jgi:hypothetical protein